MKQLILISFFLFFNISFSQKKVNCFDDIYYEEINNNLTIIVKGKELKFIQPKELFQYSSCKIMLTCNYNYLNLIYEFQNGNEYKFVNNIFKFKEGFYYLKNIFTTYSDRYQTSLTGINCNGIKLDDYSIKSDLFNKKNEEKEISLITGHQEYKETDEIPYYKLITKTFNKKKFDDIKLFTNEFVIDELGIEENLSINEFNNVAFFSYKSKAYDESIYILNKIIKKYPARTVAYLNLADCYWELKDKDKAKENYKKYIQLMTEQKKDLKKIPKYVYERIK